MKNIDFRNGRPLVMMVSQYDFGYSLQAALWSNGTPVTITAAEIVSENFTTTCTFSGNVVTIPVTTSMTEQFGHFPAELRVTDSTGQVSSKNFDFFVERSPLAVKSTETYSGDIVEFTAKSVPLSSVVVTMEPIQSLNGYDAPWPAGGGKNKLLINTASQTVGGLTITKDPETGIVTIDGTATANGNSNIFESTTELGGLSKGVSYTATVEDSNLQITVYYYDGSYIAFQNTSQRECTFTIPDTATGFMIRIRWTSGKSFNGDNIGLMIRLASDTDPTYAPYSNICPISGRTGASVLVNSEYSETGATTYPITFTSAGTVYAGTVDVVSGVLTVTHELKNANTLTWRKSGSNLFVYAQLASTTDTSTRTEIWCNIAKYMNVQSAGGNDNIVYWGGVVSSDTNNGNLCIMASAVTSVLADWNTYIDNNDVQILYKLATPLTYNLTPVQVMSLLGENVVWSPDGEVTVVVPEYY